VGFQRQGKVYRLVWPEGHDNHGLEVRMRPLSIAELQQIGSMAELDLSSDAGPEAMAALDDMIGLFASKLIGWNLDDDQGEPVPATFDGAKAQDTDFVLELIDAWMTAAAGVTPPLPNGSTGGGTPLAASIPMEPLSPSLAS
jgi:hypothetical protein